MYKVCSTNSPSKKEINKIVRNYSGDTKTIPYKTEEDNITQNTGKSIYSVLKSFKKQIHTRDLPKKFKIKKTIII